MCDNPPYFDKGLYEVEVLYSDNPPYFDKGLNEAEVFLYIYIQCCASGLRDPMKTVILILK
jgi:hypothetical protein